MRLFSIPCLALLFGISFQSVAQAAATPPGPAGALFGEWIAAFNSGDKAAIKAFYGTYLDDPEPTVMLDRAEDTCGFDVVRVEAQTALTMSVLLAERCFPALQRLKIAFAAPGDAKPKEFLLKAFRLSPEGAIDAMAATADRLAEQDKFAGSLLVARADGEVWSQSWGTLDKTEQTPITADTPMFLASAGKMFTAVAVLQLVEQGKIDLDAPFGRYLTDHPNKDMAQATIRQLLQHRSGADDIGVLARDEGENRAKARTIADLIQLNGARAPLFPPGSKTEYSNYGFLLLGAVVERVSGESFYDYVKRHVFEPAGMTNAGFPDLEHLQGVGIGYTTFFGDEPELVSNVTVLPWRGTPAGGGVASANDMLKFLRALSAGKLLSPELLQQATTPGATPWYGLGFITNTSPTSWGHGGGSYGMSAAAQIFAGGTTYVCLGTRDMACDRLFYPWHQRMFGLTK